MRILNMNRGKSLNKRVRDMLCPALIFGSLLLAGTTGVAQTQQPQQEPAKKPTSAAIDEKANELLKKMSEYLKQQKSFSFVADNSLQVVTKEGQKVNFESESKVAVERPNKLRSDRKGQLADLSVFYDGKDLAIYGKGTNYYAKTKAPPNLDAAIDFARDKLGIEAPAADLVMSKPYEVLTSDVVSGKYIGKAEVNGQPAHHLAFRGNSSDWQIWIAEGPKPVPIKYIIVSKDMPEAPEFVVEMSNWDTSPRLPVDYFTFTPPKDATRIAFAGELKKSANQMQGQKSESDGTKSSSTQRQ